MLEQLPNIFGPINGEAEVVKKVWGTEYILPGTYGYTTKLMKVKPGGKCSVHFHKFKSETFILIGGELTVNYFTQKGEQIIHLMSNQFDSLILPSCTPHTFYVFKDAKEDAVFIESSTTDDPDDSYRLSRSSYNAD